MGNNTSFGNLVKLLIAIPIVLIAAVVIGLGVVNAVNEIMLIIL